MRSNIPKARSIIEDLITVYPMWEGRDRLQEALNLMVRAKAMKHVSLSGSSRITEEQKAHVRNLFAAGIYTNTEIAERALGHSSRSGRVTEIMQGQYD